MSAREENVKEINIEQVNASREIGECRRDHLADKRTDKRRRHFTR